MKLLDLFEADEQNIDGILNTIDGDCSDMLEAYQHARKVLYRGSDSKRMLFSKKSIRQDRRPVEMDNDSHDLINKALASMKLPTRGNSLFVSADEEIARSWGTLNAVFVPNGWTGLVYDAIGKRDYSFDRLGAKAYDLRSDNRGMSEEDKVEEMAKTIKKLNPRAFTSPKDLSEVLTAGYGDILIHAPAYYRLNLDREFNQVNQRIARELKIKLFG